jgi:hypothetical protein
MSDRVYASMLYLVVIIGAAWAAVTLGEALTRAALTQLALIPLDYTQRPSRVDAYMAEQSRAPDLQNEKQPLIPAAPTLQAGALAKAMDEAEEVTNADGQTGNEPAESAPVVQVPEAEKPRVAGWVRRIPKRALSAVVPDETSGRIIMRSLRAEM